MKLDYSKQARLQQLVEIGQMAPICLLSVKAQTVSGKLPGIWTIYKTSI
jgi:hypothetical protein